MSIFYQRLRNAIREQGGMFNAHLHLDRAGTLDEQYLSHIDFRILDASYKSLHEKHSVINDIHEGRAYDADDLSRRVNACLDEMVAVDTVRADTMVDCTDDRVGLSALETLQSIKRARASQITLISEARARLIAPRVSSAESPTRSSVQSTIVSARAVSAATISSRQAFTRRVRSSAS